MHRRGGGNKVSVCVGVGGGGGVSQVLPLQIGGEKRFSQSEGRGGKMV